MDLKNIPKFLSLKTHCDVILHYGVDPGKVIHGSVIKKIQNYPSKKSTQKIIKYPQGHRKNRN